MFITIQFSLLDYRLIQENSNRFDRPKWPEPKEKEIVRYFGQVLGRDDKVTGPWDGDKRYCDARGVINLCGTGEEHFFKQLHESAIGSRVLFRRFQSDGRFFAKYDIGFDDSFEQTIETGNGHDPVELIYQHAAKYILCPVRVKTGSRLSPFQPLIDAGKHLRNAFYWSSFKETKKSFDPKELKYQVEDGEPVMIIQVDPTALDLKGLAAKKVVIPELASEGIELFFDYIPYSQGRNRFKVKAWIIAAPGSKKNDPLIQNYKKYSQTMRFLRVNLLRIHQEHNILKRLFSLFTEERFKNSADAVKETVFYYLHGKILNLSEAYRNKQSQDKLVAIAFQLDENSFGADKFSEQLEGINYFLDWVSKKEGLAKKEVITDYLNRNKTSISEFIDKNGLTVFISYNHANEDIAGKLTEKLAAENINVILDSRSMLAGTDIKSFITNSIKISEATLSIVSKESLQSAWVGVETVNTLNYKEFFPGKKFIPCNIDKDFFGDDFVINAVKKIDDRIDVINKKIAEQNALKIDTQNFNDEFTRLYFLRNHLTQIVAQLKGGLCTDITPGNFEVNFPKIIKAIRG